MEYYNLVLRTSQQFISCFDWWTYRRGVAKAGTSTLVWSGIIKTTAFIVLSPAIGMVLGFIFMVLSMNLNHRSNIAQIR